MQQIRLPPRPVWESTLFPPKPKALSLRIEPERSDEKKYQLQREIYEGLKFQARLSDWNRQLDQSTDQPRLKLLQALQDGRLVATGRHSHDHDRGFFELMDKETEGWSSPRYVDREPVPPDFWSSAKIDWDDSLAEGVTKERPVRIRAYSCRCGTVVERVPYAQWRPIWRCD